MEAKLPNFLLYKSASDLIRVGKDNDGGYLVSKSDIENSNSLISLGISDDWSFEENFSKIKEVEIFAYDGSVSKKRFFKKIIYNFVRFKFSRFIGSLKKYYEFISFFKNPKNHFYNKFVGLDDVNKNRGHLSLASIFNKSKEKNIFLKIDIEGSEYRLLDTIIAKQDFISGLVIEFHDCDLNQEAIKNFINIFNLKIVHIHANNFSGINIKNKMPLVLEVTFSKYGKKIDETLLPHELDMPNNGVSSEINLTFEI